MAKVSNESITELPLIIRAGDEAARLKVYELGGTTSTIIEPNGDERVYYADDRDSVVRARTPLMPGLLARLSRASATVEQPIPPIDGAIA